MHPATGRLPEVARCRARATAPLRPSWQPVPLRRESPSTSVATAEAAAETYTSHTRDVYHRCMTRLRTNIEIEDDLVQEVMTRYALRTKTEAVDLALRHLAGQPMGRDEALSMRGARAMEDVPEDRVPRGAA